MYGKINSITKANGTVINYGYDAAGNRIVKTVNATGMGTVNTFYVRDAQGNTMSVYADSAAAGLKLNEQHVYGSSRLGMYTWGKAIPATAPVPQWLGGNNYTKVYDSILPGSMSYELSNHLGNVLSVISDKKIGLPLNDTTVAYYVAEVLSQNDYYPFGMMMPGRKFNASSLYRYGFNGKENDNEVKGEGDQQDYGMRIYDPRLGKFLSVDPITKNYPELTPFQFASNTPIQAIDIDGLEAWVIITTQVGKNKPIITLKFDKDLKNPGGVYAIHRKVEPKSNFVESQSSGDYSYSNYKKYFPNFAAGIRDEFSFSKFMSSFSANAEANILFGEAGLEGTFLGAKLGGSIGAEGKLIGLKLGTDKIDIKRKDYNPLGWNSTFRENDQQLNFGAGVSYVAGISYRHKFDLSKGEFQNNNSITVNGVVTTAEINGYTKQSYLSWGFAGKAAIGLGLNYDAKFKINMTSLGQSLKPLSIKYTEQEKKELEVKKPGTKEFNPNNY